MSKFQIGNIVVGDNHPTVVIAELICNKEIE